MKRRKKLLKVLAKGQDSLSLSLSLSLEIFLVAPDVLSSDALLSKT
jgi:hypothetical protein